MTKLNSAIDKNKLIITRIISAPKELVFKAWTDPEYLKTWWGPKGFTAPVIKIDFRKGGKYLYSMKDSDGKMYWSAGKFKKIDIPNQIVITDYFSDENGNKLKPSDYEMDPNFPEESTVVVKFDKEHKKTRLSVIYDLPKSPKIRDAVLKSGMEEGWNSSLDKFQELLEEGNGHFANYD